MKDFKDIEYNPKSYWETMNEEEKKKVMEFSKDYIDFMNAGKTEREVVEHIVDIVKNVGYEDFDEIIKQGKKLVPGQKIYSVSNEKALILAVIGESGPEKGFSMIGSHVDAPRLDFKPLPLYEDSSFALAKTHYYGGIKKYQWVAIPLAMHGVVVKNDGTKVRIRIGDKEDDPVFTISDLLPHLSQEQLKKEASNFIQGENLNVFLGSMPLKMDEDSKETNLIKKNILRYLYDNYGIREMDFATAEIEVVPAFKAKDVGLDLSLVGAYAQDDRICAYTSLRAILEIEKSEKTCICYFSDKEEIGSVGITGARSNHFETFIYELCYALTNDSNPLIARRALKASKMLSADVTAGFDPTFPEVSDKTNATYLGKGVSIAKYTGARGKSGASDANPEFVAEFTSILNKENIPWQIGEMGKIDLGGGGTIAQYMADIGIEVLDCGPGVLSMHSPFEITSKADIYGCYKAYKCFYENI
jgi:aspartyl aminopeptidase